MNRGGKKKGPGRCALPRALACDLEAPALGRPKIHLVAGDDLHGSPPERQVAGRRVAEPVRCRVVGDGLASDRVAVEEEREVRFGEVGLLVADRGGNEGVRSVVSESAAGRILVMVGALLGCQSGLMSWAALMWIRCRLLPSAAFIVHISRSVPLVEDT